VTTPESGAPTTPDGAQAAADGEPSPFVSEEEVREALKDVIDPELGINVVDLGLVYGITVDQGNAVVDMTLTSAACPLTDVLEEQTFAALDPICETHRINWVWMPPWGMEMITEDGREQLRAIGFNL
jgi:metal-sulfur cluster biosynthetic enzyme